MIVSVRCLVRRGSRYLARRGVEQPASEARLILCHASRQTRLDAATMTEVSAVVARTYLGMLGLRGRRIPLAYITGSREFRSLSFLVTPGTLIPRPETELLVEAVLGAGKPAERTRIADIGTGCGVLAVSLAISCPSATVWATDNSGVALDIARINAVRHGVGERVVLLRGNLLEPLLTHRPMDAIVCNPPYVTLSQHRRLRPEVRCHEPAGALVSGRDGLLHLRRVIRRAAGYLRPGGILACEVGAWQKGRVDMALSRNAAWSAWTWLQDLAGIDRVFVATRGGG